MKEVINLIICGVGGQGNVLASQIVASAAMKENFYAIIGEVFGASQRGGSVQSHVRISEKKEYGPLIPEGKAHIIVGFEPVETLRIVGEFGNPDTKVIVNPRPVYPPGVLSGRQEYPSVEEVLKNIGELVGSVKVVEATEIAKRAGEILTQNVVMIGCLAASGFLPMKMESFEEVIKEIFMEKNLEVNMRAFKLGVEVMS